MGLAIVVATAASLLGAGGAAADTPGTTMLATPNTDLNPEGQTVQVSGSGWTANSSGDIAQCIQVDEFTEDCSDPIGSYTTNGSGNIVPVNVNVQMSFIAGGNPVTCSLAQPCSLFSSDNGFPPKNAHATLSFAPPGPTITVTPGTGLNPTGQVVSVSGTGFAPNTPGDIFQCVTMTELFLDDCSDPIGSFTADGSGNWGPVNVTVSKALTTPSGPRTCSNLNPCSVWGFSFAPPSPPTFIGDPISFTPSPPEIPADFTGDGMTDFSVYRPSNSIWYIQGGPTMLWGTTGDVPVSADYDDDGITEIAVFRPSNGVWYVQGGPTTAWGGTGDIPVPADYTGDGSADIAVFRPSTGAWYFEGRPTTIAWGTSGDIPVPADYDGDGDDDVAVFRPSTATWYIDGGPTTVWGTSGDIPVPGDYDGDGDADVAVFRPSTGTWYVFGGANTAWGTNGDIPVPGNYDGDANTELAVFRPSTGVWYVQAGPSGAWGTNGDSPAPLPEAIQSFF